MQSAAIGVTHAYPKARFALMTLTYQTRRWYRRGYVIEPWHAFMLSLIHISEPTRPY